MDEDFKLEDLFHSLAKEPSTDNLTKDCANFLGAANAIIHSRATLIYMAQDNFSLRSPFMYDSLEVIEESGETTHVSAYVLSLYLGIKLPRDPELHFDSAKRMQIFGSALINKGYEITFESLVTTGFIAVDNELKEKFKKKLLESGNTDNLNIIKMLDNSPNFTGKDFLNHFFTDMFY